MQTESDPPNRFCFATCQVGAEQALKAEFAREHPELHSAFSRPGFVTFKIPAGHPLSEKLVLRSVFSRAYGYSLGKVTAADLPGRVGEFWRLAEPIAADALHVWQRDTARPGDWDFEPGISPLAIETGAAILNGQSAVEIGWSQRAKINRRVRAGEQVLDCILVEPDQWYAGYHVAQSIPSRWPGGMIAVDAPEDAVSRAYLKTQEALAWSRLPIRAGEVCVDLGSAPGGSSQALLSHGLMVYGIDPADMHSAVLAHPNFRHIRMRGADLKRRDYRGVRWLTADMNVAPGYTLDTVESIVTHPGVGIRGLLLTLKLLDWSLAEHIPAFIHRVHAWGYRDVRARQLAHNRQEICLAALKHRSLRRLHAGSKRRRQSGAPNSP